MKPKATKTKKRKKALTDDQKIRKAIRDLEHWSFHGNTATNPGGRFKKVIDFILAVERVTRAAKDAIARREKAKKVRW
jgi:hypothetical protein